jgi:hypothetical protein
MMKLDKVALGLTAGMLWGASVFVATLWAGFASGGEHLGLLSRFSLGYSMSLFGAILGLVYGFVDGFICGWPFGGFYNRFSKA